MTKDDKRAQHSKGIQCKLNWDNLEKIKNIYNERMKGKFMASI